VIAILEKREQQAHVAQKQLHVVMLQSALPRTLHGRLARLDSHMPGHSQPC
jgi:hypothetical protein